MLDTLAEAGAVAIDPDTQQVRLLKASYQPLAGSEDQLAYLTQNLGDHFDAATDNVLGQEPPHFERAVYYTNLTTDQIAELEATYEANQMNVLKGLSTRAAEMKADTKTKTKTETKFRFRAGGYFYRKQETKS